MRSEGKTRQRVAIREISVHGGRHETKRFERTDPNVQETRHGESVDTPCGKPRARVGTSTNTSNEVTGKPQSDQVPKFDPSVQ